MTLTAFFFFLYSHVYLPVLHLFFLCFKTSQNLPLLTSFLGRDQMKIVEKQMLGKKLIQQKKKKKR